MNNTCETRWEDVHSLWKLFLFLVFWSNLRKWCRVLTVARCAVVCGVGEEGGRNESTSVQSAREALRIAPFRFRLRCMTDFRTRPRLIVHFRKCLACVDGMRMYGMSTLGPEEMEELDAADRMLAANMKRQGRALFDAASEPAHSVRVAMNEEG